MIHKSVEITQKRRREKSRQREPFKPALSFVTGTNDMKKVQTEKHLQVSKDPKGPVMRSKQMADLLQTVQQQRTHYLNQFAS